MATPAARKTVRELIKQGWSEIPEIFASTGLALVGIGMAITGVYRYNKNDGDNRKYKMTYVIMRPDDPKAKLVHKD